MNIKINTSQKELYNLLSLLHDNNDDKQILKLVQNNPLLKYTKINAGLFPDVSFDVDGISYSFHNPQNGAVNADLVDYLCYAGKKELLAKIIDTKTPFEFNPRRKTLVAILNKDDLETFKIIEPLLNKSDFEGYLPEYFKSHKKHAPLKLISYFDKNPDYPIMEKYYQTESYFLICFKQGRYEKCAEIINQQNNPASFFSQILTREFEPTYIKALFEQVQKQNPDVFNKSKFKDEFPLLLFMLNSNCKNTLDILQECKNHILTPQQIMQTAQYIDKNRENPKIFLAYSPKILEFLSENKINHIIPENHNFVEHVTKTYVKNLKRMEITQYMKNMEYYVANYPHFFKEKTSIIDDLNNLTGRIPSIKEWLLDLNRKIIITDIINEKGLGQASKLAKML